MLLLSYILLIATLIGYVSKHLVLRHQAAKSARMQANLNWKTSD